MMGGQTGSQMGGATSPTQATTGTGMPAAGGFDLSKLFMGNQANTPAGGGQALPQIMAPPRQPMPTMPQRTPMPQMQQPSAGGNFWDNKINQLSMRQQIEADPAGFSRYWKHQMGQAAQMSPVEKSRARGGR